MTSVAKWVSLALACVLLPVAGLAQEATLGRTVTDSTGGVLPGAVVTAIHNATGNTFQGVADERGAYRIPVRIGAFTMTAELQGFGTGTRKVQLLRRLCENAPGPTCLRPSANTIAPPPEFAHVPYSYQTSFGMQRQVGEVMALEVDYAYIGGRHERFGQGHNPVMNFNYQPRMLQLGFRLAF